MLILTESAAEAIKSVIPAEQASGGGGVRIASSVPRPQEASALQVAVAPGPGQGDQVIEAAGARVFVAPQAAGYLGDKVLDAQLDAQGQARFSLGAQRPGQA